MCGARSAARLERYEDAPKSVQFPLSQSLVKWVQGIWYGTCIMSEKVERPKKKATANPGRLETQDMPSVTPRKRRTGRTADRAPSTHEVGRHAEPTPRGAQGRRSDRKPACSCQPHSSEKDHVRQLCLFSQPRWSANAKDIHKRRPRIVGCLWTCTVPAGPTCPILVHDLSEPDGPLVYPQAHLAPCYSVRASY